jgi:hypothetical protein
MTTAAMCESCNVFVAWVMTGISYVPLAVPSLIRVEVVERSLPAIRHRSYVAVMRIVAVIDVAIEAMWTMEPRPGSDEDPTNEPISPIVAIGSTVVWGIVKVPVWANGRDSNVDRNLSRYNRTAGEDDSSSKDH